jgi:hypothetical protein
MSCTVFADKVDTLGVTKNRYSPSYRNLVLLVCMVSVLLQVLGSTSLAYSKSLNQVTEQRMMRSYVDYLSADALEGRMTGSDGEKKAIQFIARIFDDLGLEPAGDDGTFFQRFQFTSGLSFGNDTTLSIKRAKTTSHVLKLEQDWIPLAFSNNATFKLNELVFIGYGITAPKQDKLPEYDSYRRLNVKGKWVIAFTGIPEDSSIELKQQLIHYSSLRYKTYTAKEHGAKGIIFIRHAPPSAFEEELTPFTFDASLSDSGMVVFSVSNRTVNELLKESTFKLDSLEQLQSLYRLPGPRSVIKLKNTALVGRINIIKNKKYGHNILARLKLTDNLQHQLVVSAHVDHLGRGELSGSRAEEQELGLIHSGADDDASGVAVVLQTARKLAELKKEGVLHGQKNILFALWSGEELGLLGSSYFVNHCKGSSNDPFALCSIEANINLDMVGRLRDHLIIQGIGSGSLWKKLIKQVNNHYLMRLIYQNDPYLPTDSTSFYLHQIPTLNFFTGSHEEYHTPRDKAGTLNYAGMVDIGHFLIDLVVSLEKNTVHYKKITSKTNVNLGGTFRIYLGTIPDYASTNSIGVEIAGVKNNSPAQHAGLKKKDIIIALAGKKISNLYDYMYTMNALPIGKPVELIILRNKSKRVLQITGQPRN